MLHGQMFTALETWLITLTASAPLPFVSFAVAVLEEIVPPIPASATIATIGTMAALQTYTVPGLFLLTIAAAFGKTFGSIGVYIVSDKAEDILMQKVGKYFGVSSADLEKLSRRLGNGWRDYFALTLLRSLPFVPSALVSVGCGMLRIPWPLYLVATLIGTIVRYGIFLYLGFIGATVLTSFIDRTEWLGNGVKVAVVVGAVGVLTYLYIRRRRSKTSPK